MSDGVRDADAAVKPQPGAPATPPARSAPPAAASSTAPASSTTPPSPRASKPDRSVHASTPQSRRVRSQPLAVRPAPGTPAAAVEEEQPQAAWRWTPVVAGIAALAWLVAIGMLAGSGPALSARVSSPRVLLLAAWAIAAVVTFGPIELRLGLPGLTWQGAAGWMLLAYMLAFVPPPTGWLLELPDLPVYLLFFVALFYAVGAAALPLTYILGRRMYARRMHQLDLRRARRQAREIGLLAVALIVLASLRVLMPLTGLLIVGVFVLVETLLLSQVAPES